MKRKSIPKNLLKDIFIKSRRRCCLCYGLNRDMSIKQGQIAHVDHNSLNNNVNNLAYLCLDHHCAYDGRTSQSRGFIDIELIFYRDELYDMIDKSWDVPIVAQNIYDPISGCYTRIGDRLGTELQVILIGQGDLAHIHGLALWATESTIGPHVGTIDGDGIVESNRILFTEKRFDDKEYRLELIFNGNGALTAKETNRIGHFGVNVSFQGEYRRR